MGGFSREADFRQNGGQTEAAYIMTTIYFYLEFLLKCTMNAMYSCIVYIFKSMINAVYSCTGYLFKNMIKAVYSCIGYLFKSMIKAIYPCIVFILKWMVYVWMTYAIYYFLRLVLRGVINYYCGSPGQGNGKKSKGLKKAVVATVSRGISCKLDEEMANSSVSSEPAMFQMVFTTHTGLESTSSPKDQKSSKIGESPTPKDDILTSTSDTKQNPVPTSQAEPIICKNLKEQGGFDKELVSMEKPEALHTPEKLLCTSQHANEDSLNTVRAGNTPGQPTNVKILKDNLTDALNGSSSNLQNHLDKLVDVLKEASTENHRNVGKGQPTNAQIDQDKLLDPLNGSSANVQLHRDKWPDALSETSTDSSSEVADCLIQAMVKKVLKGAPANVQIHHDKLLQLLKESTSYNSLKFPDGVNPTLKHIEKVGKAAARDLVRDYQSSRLVAIAAQSGRAASANLQKDAMRHLNNHLQALKNKPKSRLRRFFCI